MQFFLFFFFFLNYGSRLEADEPSINPWLSLSLLFICTSSFSYERELGFDLPGSAFEDLYLPLSDLCLSDLHGLFAVYYHACSLLTIFIGLYLFLASVACVSIFRRLKTRESARLGDGLRLYSFFKDLLSFKFLRSQSMTKQSARKPRTRAFRDVQKK